MPLRESDGTEPGLRSCPTLRQRLSVEDFGPLARPHRSHHRRAAGWRGRSRFAAARRELCRCRRSRRRGAQGPARAAGRTRSQGQADRSRGGTDRRSPVRPRAGLVCSRARPSVWVCRRGPGIAPCAWHALWRISMDRMRCAACISPKRSAIAAPCSARRWRRDLYCPRPMPRTLSGHMKKRRILRRMAARRKPMVL